MQKKLIALAVAGLVSAPAFAQSNVTIYGIADIGFSHNSKSDTKEFKNRSGLDSGQQSGSRIGFRGTEDLGNGLKASFVLENAIGLDTGSGPSMVRQSFLALSGNFGTVAAGRQYTPQFNLVFALDPFGTGTVGSTPNTNGVIGQAGQLYSMGVLRSGVIRIDNLLAYVSPNLGGFTVTAGYTADGIGDEVVTAKGAKSTNAKIWAISPVYRNGPLMVGLNYHRVSSDNFTGLGLANADVKNKVWDLGGSYDFGVVKLSALYGRSKADIKGAGSLTERQWMVGATVPVSEAGSVLVGYTRNKLDQAGTDPKASKWAVGYNHSLSKRTNIYTAYARINTNTAANGDFSTYGTTANVADYTRGFNVGLRHTF